MFNFLGMMDTYDSRKVDRTEISEDAFISTASVTDGDKPYETAVCHPEYNDGDIVVVEAYDTREEAQEGHNKWVKTMTSDILPTELVECGNAEVAQLAEAVGCETKFPRKPKK